MAGSTGISGAAPAEDPPDHATTLAGVFRRFRRNLALIVGSRVLFGLLNLATHILIIRTIGLTELGIVLLLQSYVRLFAEIVRLQTWQVILRFGAVAREAGDHGGLRRLFGLVFGIDLAALTLAMLAAIACVPLAAELLDWPREVRDFAPYFVASMLFITHGAANGILRLFDRIDALAAQFALTATVRFVGVGVAVLLGGETIYLVLAWFAANLAGGVWALTACLREIGGRGYHPMLRTSWRTAGRDYPGIWRYLCMTNLSGLLTLVMNSGTALFIGAQMDAAAVATYEVARRVSVAAAKPAVLLGPLIFPEVATLAAQKDWAMIGRLLLRQLAITGAVLAGLGLLVFPALPFLVELAFGPQFADDLVLFRLLLAGGFIGALGFALEPVMLSANKSGTAALLTALGVAVYLGVAGATWREYGLEGFALGLLGYFVVRQGLMAVLNARILRKRHSKALKRSAEGL